ncbi:MAG: deoxynucleoside kinase [bacterium]|nr:deoxynucleoside kinase [bacterium]
MRHFIAISGNIGVGKSTLTERLAAELGWQAYFEPVTENPYLADFYGDMKRWAFHSQLFFLSHRLREHAALTRSKNSIIQDRSVYENAEVFAKNLYQQGHISERDWATYWNLYQTFMHELPAPNLIIYLKASVPVLQKRIVDRGRAFEKTIETSYLETLNKLHDDWVTSFRQAPVLTIDTDAIDFNTDKIAIATLARRIKKELHADD